MYCIYALLFHSHVPIPKSITSLTQSQCFFYILKHCLPFFSIFYCFLFFRTSQMSTISTSLQSLHSHLKLLLCPPLKDSWFLF